MGEYGFGDGIHTARPAGCQAFDLKTLTGQYDIKQFLLPWRHLKVPGLDHLNRCTRVATSDIAIFWVTSCSARSLFVP